MPCLARATHAYRRKNHGGAGGSPRFSDSDETKKIPGGRDFHLQVSYYLKVDRSANAIYRDNE
jgi:hypothetical protein